MTSDRTDALAAQAGGLMRDFVGLVQDAVREAVRQIIPEIAAAVQQLPPVSIEASADQSARPAQDDDTARDVPRFHRFSSEQNSVMRIMYPRGDGLQEIQDALNQLPGARITHFGQIYTKGKRLHLSRPVGALRPDGSGAGKRYYLSDRWSPERDEIIRMQWPIGIGTDVITAQINALPGAPVTNKQVGVRAAGVLKIHRPDYQGPPPSPATEAIAAPMPAATVVETPASVDAPQPPVVAPARQVDAPVPPDVAPARQVDAPVPPDVAPARQVDAPPPPVVATRPVDLPPAVAPRPPQVAVRPPVQAVRQASSSPRPRLDLTPRRATADQVRGWAAERGIQFHHADALPRVNSKRIELGLPPFELILPPGRRAA